MSCSFEKKMSSIFAQDVDSIEADVMAIVQNTVA